MTQEKGNLSINSENLFPIIKKWLYSDQDIFIREIVSNAVDAIKKRALLAGADQMTRPEGDFEVHVVLDSAAKTITVSDNGIGMTADEVKKYINQIAFSGASEFLEKYKDAAEDPIIGHFGLGFYSAFMVSEQVEIETLSATEGAEAVHWTSDGSATYEMTDGTRTEAGTDVIMHVNEDGEKYLNLYEMRSILQKYCSFMPYPIYLEEAKPARADAADSSAATVTEEGTSADATVSDDTESKGDEATASAEKTESKPEPVNETTPLYQKKPADCTDDEYKEFYRKVFYDFKEPLFWIHLNMDYPFHLKGILYFPKLGNEFESAEGQVKLYCNQVFVADNVKEIIPEFLLLLKGVIDCPDIPLNVSRSFLQNDAEVKKISDYITKKVADKLISLHNKEPENYEKYWADIHPFIKYGCLRNEKFYDRIKDHLIFHSLLSDKFVTLADYLAAAKETHENQVFYSDDARQQAQYIALLKDMDMDVVELPTAIDVPFMSFLEAKNENLRFTRVDADVSKSLAEKEETSEDTSGNTSDSAADDANTFKGLLGNDDLTVRMETFKTNKIAAMIELSEDERRMQDMMKMYGSMGLGAFGEQKAKETLVVNRNHPLVKYVLAHPDTEKASSLAHELYDLARISHENLSAEDLTTFLSRSLSLLEGLAE